MSISKLESCFGSGACAAMQVSRVLSKLCKRKGYGIMCKGIKTSGEGEKGIKGINRGMCRGRGLLYIIGMYIHRTEIEDDNMRKLQAMIAVIPCPYAGVGGVATCTVFST